MWRLYGGFFRDLMDVVSYEADYPVIVTEGYPCRTPLDESRLRGDLQWLRRWAPLVAVSDPGRCLELAPAPIAVADLWVDDAGVTHRAAFYGVEPSPMGDFTGEGENRPVEALRRLVRALPKRGTVIDPFAGFGDVGVACVLDGVDFAGIEVSNDRYNALERRLVLAERGLL